MSCYLSVKDLPFRLDHEFFLKLRHKNTHYIRTHCHVHCLTWTVDSPIVIQNLVVPGELKILEQKKMRTNFARRKKKARQLILFISTGNNYNNLKATLEYKIDIHISLISSEWKCIKFLNRSRAIMKASALFDLSVLLAIGRSKKEAQTSSIFSQQMEQDFEDFLILLYYLQTQWMYRMDFSNRQLHCREDNHHLVQDCWTKNTPAALHLQLLLLPRERSMLEWVKVFQRLGR